MPHLPLDRYRARLDAQGPVDPSLVAVAGEDAAAWGRRPVGVTFALSYDQLKPDAPVDVLARTLLHRAAACAPEPIPRRLLFRAAGLDPADEAVEDQAAPAVSRLVALGRVEELAAGDLRLHRLLAAFARSRAPDLPSDAAAVEHALADEALTIYAAGYPQAGTPYLPHLQHAAPVAAARSDAPAARLLNSLANLLDAQGDLAAARPLYARALAIREQTRGPTHPATALSLNNLALLLRAQGDLAAARPLYARPSYLHGPSGTGAPHHPHHRRQPGGPRRGAGRAGGRRRGRAGG